MCDNRQHNNWRCFGISFFSSLSFIANISLLKRCAFCAFDAVFLGQGSQIIYAIDLKTYTLWSSLHLISLIIFCCRKKEKFRQINLYWWKLDLFTLKQLVNNEKLTETIKNELTLTHSKISLWRHWETDWKCREVKI